MHKDPRSKTLQYDRHSVHSQGSVFAHICHRPGYDNVYHSAFVSRPAMAPCLDLRCARLQDICKHMLTASWPSPYIMNIFTIVLMAHNDEQMRRARSVSTKPSEAIGVTLTCPP